MKKIVVFGNQQIAIDCIKILTSKADIDLLAVVGCERERDSVFGYPSLKKFCKEKNIVYYNPEKLNSQFLEIIKGLKPDICFSIYYRNIFSPSYISIPPMGFINIHPSLLPKYRGPIPTFWALLNNEKKTGVTLHYIDSGIDTGDIIAQIDCKIPKETTGYELNNLLIEKGVELFRKQLPFILGSKNKRVKQIEALATYFGSFTQNLRIINWTLPIGQIKRQVQALTKPYSGAKSFILDEELIIWKVEILKTSKKNLPGPGRIIQVRSNGFIVLGIDGLLLVRNFELLNSQNTNKYIKIGNRFKNL